MNPLTYLKIARDAIKAHFDHTVVDKNTLIDAYPELTKQRATFVTLTLNGHLRGCIGSIIAHQSLINDIISNAESAAFRDPRFSPLSQNELDALKIEVSLLTHPELISYKDNDDLVRIIRPNIDGIIMRVGNHQATFLPQVWEELPDFDSFFSHLGLKASVLAVIRSLIIPIFIRIRSKKSRRSKWHNAPMSVAGSFYPAHANEIVSMIEHFNTILSSHPDVLNRVDLIKGNAAIVPHAGWIYSGFTANIAFHVLKNTHPKTIVVIGPSHRVGFEGASISDMESYPNTIGEI